VENLAKTIKWYSKQILVWMGSVVPFLNLDLVGSVHILSQDSDLKLLIWDPDPNQDADTNAPDFQLKHGNFSDQNLKLQILMCL
jgi:hypothetical protein